MFRVILDVFQILYDAYDPLSAVSILFSAWFDFKTSEFGRYITIPYPHRVAGDC